MSVCEFEIAASQLLASQDEQRFSNASKTTAKTTTKIIV